MRNPRLLGVVGLLAYVLGLHALATIPAEAQVIEKGVKIAAPVQPIGVPGGAIPGKGEDEQDFTDRVILPRYRPAERWVESARKYVQEEDWSNAIRLLQNLLNSKEDNFLKDEKGRWVSVRTEANRILGSMPRDGQQFYEQKYGSEARQILKRGLAAGDPQVYADVALRYMHTDAGSEAASHLGTYHLDHGRYIVAALCYERLLSREGMLERLPAITLYKAAIAFERASDLKNRDRVWAQFQQRVENGENLPSALRRMDAGQLRLALALKESARPPGESTDWPLFLGSPNRSALASGGAPFLAPRFKLEMVRSPQVKDWLEKALTRHSSKAQAQLCGFHPIAVGGKLVFRSFWGVHAYNLKTGELEWEAPAGMSLDYMARERNIVDPTGQMNNWLNIYQSSVPTLFYDNSTLGTLSSDSQRVYFVEDLAIPPHPNYLIQNRWGGMPPLGPQLQKWMEHNKLSAYDLNTGKLQWELGTEDPDKPFAGTFFLGPPLPIGEKLYVLAESGTGDIRLLCIDPVGKASLVWSQTLCLVERRLSEDPARRMQAAHLAYGDGMLVCPTNAGVILAVDLLTRSLVWAHSYQESGGDSNKNVKGMAGMAMPGGYAAATVTPATWASAAPIVREGMVVLTAPDGESVRCLNLRDGALVWREARQNDLYLAGVFGDKVVLVGKESCRALTLKDGKEQWKVSTGLPSGRGVCNGKEYFLPLKSGEVWTIELDKGEIRGKSRSGRVAEGSPPIIPGNLVFHDGEVISQSATLLAVFPQLAAKESAITKLLQQNPNDPRGLTERGDLRLNRGDLVGAVADLRTALAQKDLPAEVRRTARERLYEALGDLLQRDFAANEKHLPEFEQLIPIAPAANETDEQKAKREEDERDRKARLLRVVAKGREEQGRLTESLQAYLDFRKLGRKELLTIPEEPATRALPEVWIQGRISELIRRAKPEQRQTLEQALELKWKEAQKTGTIEALEEFAGLFGPLCAQGQKAKLLLAERLLEDKQFEQAQIRLWALAKQAEPEVAALALDALARVNTKLGELENAAYFYRLMAQKYPKIIIRDAKTAEDVFLELATDKRFLPYLDEPRRGWTSLAPGEKLKAEMAFGSFAQAQQNFWLEPEGDVPPQLRRYRLGVDQGTYRFKMVDPTAPAQSERGGFQLRGVLKPQVVSSNNSKFRPTYRVAGGVVVFTWGVNVYGFDPMKPKELLWSYSLLGDYELGPNAVNMGFNLMPNANGQLEIFYGDGYRERLGTLGPVEPSFVTFLVKDEGLVAVDPLKVDDKKRPVKRWVRSDVPIGTDIFGDGEHLYLVLAGRGEGGAGKGVAIRAIDGAPVDVPEFASLFQRRHRIYGRMLLLRDTDPQGPTTLRLYDVLTGKDVWKKPIDPQTVLLNSFEHDLVGHIDPLGKLSVLRIDSGKEVLSASLDATAMKNTPEVHLIGDAGQLFVVFNSPPDPNAPLAERRSVYPHNTGMRTVLVSGPLYAFERATGKERWRRSVPPHALIVEQFDDMPILLFASMQQIWVQPQGGGGQPPFQRYANAVLALDKRDGLDGLGGKAKGGQDEVFKDEPQNRGGAFYAVRVDPRLGVVELFSHNYKVMFKLASETAKADEEAKPQGRAEVPAERQVPAIQIVPGQAGQIRMRLQQQQLEEVRRAMEQAEQARRAAQEAERRAKERAVPDKK